MAQICLLVSDEHEECAIPMPGGEGDGLPPSDSMGGDPRGDPIDDVGECSGGECIGPGWPVGGCVDDGMPIPWPNP